MKIKRNHVKKIIYIKALENPRTKNTLNMYELNIYITPTKIILFQVLQPKAVEKIITTATITTTKEKQTAPS